MPASDSNDEFAGVFTVVEHFNSPRRCFSAVQDMFADVDSPLAQPCSELASGFGEPILVIKDQETLHAGAGHKQLAVDARADGQRLHSVMAAVPQMVMRAPWASLLITASEIGPQVLSK